MAEVKSQKSKVKSLTCVPALGRDLAGAGIILGGGGGGLVWDAFSRRVVMCIMVVTYDQIVRFHGLFYLIFY